MEWFTVKYRQPDGVVSEAEFEAADRSALFEILSKQNISAISVNSGRLGKKSARKTVAKKSPSASPKYARGVIAGLIVVATAAFTWFFFMSRDVRDVTEEKSDINNGDVSKLVPKGVDITRNAEKTTETIAEMAEKSKKSLEDIYPKTNADGSVIKKLRDGRTYLVRPRSKDWKKKYPFDNPVETQLSWYAIPGAEAPPLLPMVFSERDITDALTHRIEIDPEDDDETIAIKESVEELKGQLKSWIKNGGTVEDYIRQIARRQALEADNVNESRNMVMEAIQNGEIGLAKELAEKLNERLQNNGLPAIRLPRKYREMIENHKE